MKLIKTCFKWFKQTAIVVVVFSMLLLLLMPGFLLTLIGFYFVMYFFWLGEYLRIFEIGSYNEKHILMVRIMGHYRELLGIDPIVKR